MMDVPVPRSGLHCAKCNGSTIVIDSRGGRNDTSGSYIRRRRKCTDCDSRFTTFESASLQHAAVLEHLGGHTDAVRQHMKAIETNIREIDILMRHRR